MAYVVMLAKLAASMAAERRRGVAAAWQQWHP